jgi:predicted transcriptional regulator
MPDKLINIFLFMIGLILTLSGLLIFVMEILFVMEGFENENEKIGSYVIGFLMSPVTACGIVLMKKHRPKKRKKRIKITQILKVIQKNEHNLTNRDLMSNLNLTVREADSVLKELEKIGMGKLSSDRFGQLELSLSKITFLNKIRRKIDFTNSIQKFNKSTGIFRWSLRIFASIVFISFSMYAIIFRIPHCCGYGFYYLIFFSLLGGLTSIYLIWSYKKEKKKVFPKFIEIES